LGLKQNLCNLHRQLEVLDSKPQLKKSLENLKKDTLSKASDLEAEVNRLREDLKYVRDLLGLKPE
jgi:hypothetical protein